MKPLLLLARAVFVLVWTAVWICLASIATLFTFSKETALVLGRHAWAPGLLWGAGIRLHVDPLPDIDWKTPHIYVMNHQSMADIPCAFAALPANLRFVAKHSLKWIPFLGWYMTMTGMIFIDRSNRKKSMESLRLAGKRIRDGANIIAYPEGTRSPDGQILPFKKGPFALAIEAGVPVVPVAVEGTARALPLGGLRFEGGPVRLRVGSPIATQRTPAIDKEDLLNEVREAIIALHQDLAAERQTE